MGAAEPASFDTVGETIRTNHYGDSPVLCTSIFTQRQLYQRGFALSRSLASEFAVPIALSPQ